METRRTIIRKSQVSLSSSQAPTIQLSNQGRHRRSGKSFGSSGAALASYFGVFLLVVVIVAIGYHPPVKDDAVTPLTNAVATDSNAVQSNASTPVAGSVDKLVATDVAATIAESTDLPVTNNVTNLSQSLAAESTLAQTDTDTTTKPQIVQPGADTRASQKYKAKSGDTVQSVANKFGVSATTIKWANDLTDDTLEPGKILTIPPVDGVIYTVRSGDTVDKIASTYRADKASIIAYNDLELSGLPSAGKKIIIPGGNLPASQRPGYVAPTTNTYNSGYNSGTGSSTPVNFTMTSGNRYAWGNCTWYAYERRQQLGMPIGGNWGNANTWAYYAAASGFRVDGTPSAGAVMQNGGGYGHVAIVESVIPGKSIVISEMNGYRFGGGFARIARGSISWSEATSGYYRYIH